MKTIYTVGQPDRDSSFIGFDTDWAAIHWWHENVENAPKTDVRHGSVVKKHEFETDAEAETARLNYLLESGDVPYPMTRPASDADRLAEQRRIIDIRRKAPQSSVVQIWPKPSKRAAKGAT